MQTNYDKISAAGGSLIAISVDGPTAAKAAADAIDNTFTVLSDGKAVIEDYYVLNPRSSHLALPSVFIIKTDGTIGWKSIDSTYSRTSSSSIISALKGLE